MSHEQAVARETHMYISLYSINGTAQYEENIQTTPAYTVTLVHRIGILLILPIKNSARVCGVFHTYRYKMFLLYTMFLLQMQDKFI